LIWNLVLLLRMSMSTANRLLIVCDCKYSKDKSGFYYKITENNHTVSVITHIYWSWLSEMQLGW